MSETRKWGRCDYKVETLRLGDESKASLWKPKNADGARRTRGVQSFLKPKLNPFTVLGGRAKLLFLW